MSAIHADAEKEKVTGDFGYSDWELIKFMISYGGPYKKDLVIIMVFMVVYTSTISLGPIVLLKAIDRFAYEEPFVFEVGLANTVTNQLLTFFQSLGLSSNGSEIAIIGLYYLGIQLAVLYASIMQRRLLAIVGQRVILQIRQELFDHLMELDMSYHDQNEVGRIMSRTTSDVQAIGQFIGGQVMINVINIFTIVFAVYAMIQLNLFLSFVSILMIVPVVVMSIVARKFARPRRKEARRTNAMLMANLAENIAGIKVTKGLTREHDNKRMFERINQERKLAQIRAIDVNAIFFPSMMLLSGIATAVIMLVGGRLVIQDVITIGTLFAFINYNTILFRPIVILGNLYEQIQDALTGAERVLSLKQTQTNVPFNDHLPALPSVNGEVEFKDLDFSYVPGRYVYKDFSLHVKPGTKVALVGHTGAGKTTIINILTRLYEFQDGFLFIDREDVTNYSLLSYKEQMAAVPQDFFLFSKSIRQNLLLGNPLATEEQMWDALDKVGMKRFVERLPNQLDEEVHERGGRLSIGQRQLTIFAAVFIADPQILVLDEATSSIDVFTEIQIQKTLNKLLEGRTAFIIAHRLSTIRDADLICVINDGRIVEQGSHDELIAKGGEYFNLVKNQVELADVMQM